MTTFLALILLGASGEPPPQVVANALTVAPGAAVYAHGYIAGLAATRQGQRPAMGFFF